MFVAAVERLQTNLKCIDNFHPLFLYTAIFRNKYCLILRNIIQLSSTIVIRNFYGNKSGRNIIQNFRWIHTVAPTDIHETRRRKVNDIGNWSVTFIILILNNHSSNPIVDINDFLYYSISSYSCLLWLLIYNVWIDVISWLFSWIDRQVEVFLLSDYNLLLRVIVGCGDFN